MKKIFKLGLAIMIMIASAATMANAQAKQLSNSEIANIIAMSKQANANNGVTNADLVKPNQVLTFRFQNGVEQNFVVTEGQSQWNIVKSVKRFEAENGPIVNYDEPADEVVETPQPVPVVTTDWSGDDPSTWPNWLWFLLAVAIFIIGMWWFASFSTREKIAAREEARKKMADPVLAGPPVVPGGIQNDEQARLRAQEMVDSLRQSTTSRDTHNLRNIERGFIHGQAVDVFYGNGSKMNHTFINQPGYRGLIDILKEDGTRSETAIYFLQGCGNDVQQGRYLEIETNSSLRFTVERIGEDASLNDVQNAPIQEGTITERNSTASNTATTSSIVVKPKAGETTLPLSAEAIELILKTVAQRNTKVSLSVTPTEIKFDAEAGVDQPATEQKLLASQNGQVFTEVVEPKKES